jgi:hypothetical protein
MYAYISALTYLCCLLALQQYMNVGWPKLSSDVVNIVAFGETALDKLNVVWDTGTRHLKIEANKQNHKRTVIIFVYEQAAKTKAVPLSHVGAKEKRIIASTHS